MALLSGFLQGAPLEAAVKGKALDVGAVPGNCGTCEGPYAPQTRKVLQEPDVVAAGKEGSKKADGMSCKRNAVRKACLLSPLV